MPYSHDSNTLDPFPKHLRSIFQDGHVPVSLITNGLDLSPSPEHSDQFAAIWVSTVFSPHASFDPSDPDIIFLSADVAMFYVHRDRIASSSPRWASMVPTTCERASAGSLPMVTLPENSVVLDVMLRAIYQLSDPQHNPAIETIVSAVDALEKYGVRIKTLFEPTSQLFKLVLRHAPLRPLETYAFAAQHGLEALAVLVSPYLLSVDISSISDDTAIQIGPIYFKRLIVLQHSRLTSLRGIIYSPPYPHPPMAKCDLFSRTAVSRAWNLASAQLLIMGKADLSTSDIQAILGSLANSIQCPMCAEGLNNRVREVTSQWLLLDRTI